MALPFTVEQFCGVFRDCNAVVWPMLWIFAALALRSCSVSSPTSASSRRAWLALLCCCHWADPYGPS